MNPRCEYCQGEITTAKRKTRRFCDDLCAQRHRREHGQPCPVAGCPNRVETKGYCGAHYRRLRTHGDPLGHLPLNAVNAGQPLRNQGLCSLPGCERPAKTRELCAGHYGRYLTGALDRDRSPIRTIAACGKGSIDQHGYRVVRRTGHPNAWKNGQIFEHVLVMATHLGRPLVKGETVHHRNGQRADNDLANLELWTGRHGRGQRAEDRVADALETLRLYAPALLASSR